MLDWSLKIFLNEQCQLFGIKVKQFKFQNLRLLMCFKMQSRVPLLVKITKVKLLFFQKFIFLPDNILIWFSIYYSSICSDWSDMRNSNGTSSHYSNLKILWNNSKGCFNSFHIPFIPGVLFLVPPPLVSGGSSICYCVGFSCLRDPKRASSLGKWL